MAYPTPFFLLTKFANRRGPKRKSVASKYLRRFKKKIGKGLAFVCILCILGGNKSEKPIVEFSPAGLA